MAGEAPDCEKFIRDAVASQLKGDQGAPLKAAALLKSALMSAAGPGADGAPPPLAPASAVRSAVAGAMKGLILAEADLGLSAVALIRMVGYLAADAQVDAQESMVWAMEGIAAAGPLMTPMALVTVQDEIESSFMGAGGIFADLCHRAQTQS